MPDAPPVGMGSSACMLLADTDADAHTGEMAAVKREIDTARDAVHCRALLYCQKDG